MATGTFNWGGLITSAAGAYTQSQGLVNSMEGAAYSADMANKIALRNAQYAEWQAQDAITRGQKEEQAVRLRTAMLKSTQRATMAARGISLTEGTPLNILTDTDYMGEIDALTVKDNALRAAWGYRENAKASGMQQVSPEAASSKAFLAGAPAVAASWLKLANTFTTDAKA